MTRTFGHMCNFPQQNVNYSNATNPLCTVFSSACLSFMQSLCISLNVALKSMAHVCMRVKSGTGKEKSRAEWRAGKNLFKSNSQLVCFGGTFRSCCCCYFCSQDRPPCVTSRKRNRYSKAQKLEIE